MFTSLRITRQIINIILVGCCILTSVAYSSNKDAFWPQFHGPNRDNLSTESGKGNSWAHPVVCGGRLYIRHGGFLYAYTLKEN